MRGRFAFAALLLLAVPQSLGYAAIAGVPVQVGLYAVPIALLVYAALSFFIVQRVRHLPSS